MEEWVGERWHGFISRRAAADCGPAVVQLASQQKALGTLYRALMAPGAGGQILPASQRVVAGSRGWLQKLAFDSRSQALPWLDDQGLHLPDAIALFNDASLNQQLYRWLTLLAAEAGHETEPVANWALRSQRAVARLWQRFPATRTLYQRLLAAHLLQRPTPGQLTGPEAALEQCVRDALANPGSVPAFPASRQPPYPIALWLYPRMGQASRPGQGGGDARQSAGPQQQVAGRKAAERRQAPAEKHGLLLFRLENLFSWSEHAALAREQDDQPDDDAARVAEDLDQLTLTEQGGVAARLKVDLDLPSGSEDDIPLGPGIWLPEYHWRSQQLLPERVCVQEFEPRASDAPAPVAHLRNHIARVRALFSQLRTERLWLSRQLQGPELDLQAWLDFRADSRAGACPEPALYRALRLQQRDIATLVLADLSMSTDAHLNDQLRILDVIRDGVYVLAEALDSVGDPFALYGFSSLKRQQVRLLHLKHFDEPAGAAVRQRLRSLRPGYYTRMGAAVRIATERLASQPQRRKLLLLITDGKPNDIDHYEGRYGLEDTRAAIDEARVRGCIPFCITVDREAGDYLPFLFGAQGYCLVQNPVQLARRLPAIYQQLTRP